MIITAFSDVNECTTDSDNCHSMATCANTVGSFTCSCNTGFEGTGITCAGKQHSFDRFPLYVDKKRVESGTNLVQIL